MGAAEVFLAYMYTQQSRSGTDALPDVLPDVKMGVYCRLFAEGTEPPRNIDRGISMGGILSISGKVHVRLFLNLDS